MISFLFNHAWWVIGLLVIAIAVAWLPAFLRFRWQIAVAAVALLAGVFWLQANSLRRQMDQFAVAAAQAATTAALDAGSRYRDAAQRQSGIDTAYQQGMTDGKAQVDALLDGRRTGDVVLRDKFRCPAAGTAAGNAAAAGIDHGAAPAVLSAADEGFLVHLAAEADDVARQLSACQQLVIADRVVGPQ